MTTFLIFAVPAVGTAAVYLASIWLHPWWPCRACDASGRTRDTIWRSAFGTCGTCGGRGRYPRLGVRVLQPAGARRLTAGQASRKVADRRGS